MIYLDNAATTRPAKEVIEAMQQALSEDFGNPSSRHRLGIRARERVESSRARIAELCQVSSDCVVFTSGGTEANNLAARGVRLPQGKEVILTSAAEHASLARPLEARTDATIRTLPLNDEGCLDLLALERALGDEVGMVAVFEGHNEIGSLNDVGKIARAVRSRSPRAFLHVDAVQSFTKTPRLPLHEGVTSVAISGHKIHGPKGIGALILNSRSPIAAQVLGGGQEHDRRSGTENVPGIVGLARAVELAFDRHDECVAYLEGLRRKLIDGVRGKIDGVRPLAAGPDHLPHLTSFVFHGVLAEPLLHHLEQHDIHASTGAACQSARKDSSPSLRALGLSDEEIRSTLRFSTSRDTRAEEIETLLSVLPELVDRLRRIGSRP